MDQNNGPSQRVIFLNDFLGALGAEILAEIEEGEEKVSGRMIYDLCDLEEFQDFCWHITEENIPGAEVHDLAKFIHEEGLLAIDKVSIPLHELYERFSRRNSSPISKAGFETVANELMEISVVMVDNGVEGDCFFIHI